MRKMCKAIEGPKPTKPKPTKPKEPTKPKPTKPPVDSSGDICAASVRACAQINSVCMQ